MESSIRDLVCLLIHDRGQGTTDLSSPCATLSRISKLSSAPILVAELEGNGGGRELRRRAGSLDRPGRGTHAEGRSRGHRSFTTTVQIKEETANRGAAAPLSVAQGAVVSDSV